MLQRIQRALDPDKALYVSLDDLYFQANSLSETAESFYQLGGRHLFLDEVHKYQDWHREVKNIYDFYPDLQIIISGSSIIALQEASVDLSRRLVRYYLPELSLREFIAIKYENVLPTIGLTDLWSDHGKFATSLLKNLDSPLKLLREYHNFGAYPFFKESEADYSIRLGQLINMIIDYDLPEAQKVEVSTLHKIKQLLYIISQSAPFTPNIAKLADKVGTSRIRLLEMLHYLHQSQLIFNLRSATRGVSLLNKPDKIFLHNTNLMKHIGTSNTNEGNVRETFFVNQISSAGHSVHHSNEGDFLIDEKNIVEVGGKNKSFNQLKKEDHRFVVSDNIEIGHHNHIPLWLFGFLY